MALAALSGDEQCIIFVQLCNVLDPGIAVAFGSINSELRALTPALLQQLRADYEAATALCRKVGLRSCKELREANRVDWYYKGLTASDLGLLGTLGSVLPALETLVLCEPAAGPDGIRDSTSSRGLGDVYKRQVVPQGGAAELQGAARGEEGLLVQQRPHRGLSLIHI